MRVAKSTVRQNLRRNPDVLIVTHEEILQRTIRQEAINRICGYGCGTCCQLNPVHADGFRCPLLEPENFAKLDDDQKGRVDKCGVPKLYEAVLKGERDPESVEEQEIHEACPFIEVR